MVTDGIPQGTKSILQQIKCISINSVAHTTEQVVTNTMVEKVL